MSQITIVPQNGFNQAITFTCSGLATGVTCTFAPATLTPSGSSTTDQLTISVPSTFAERKPPLLPWNTPGGVALATVGFLLCLRSRRFRNYGTGLVLIGTLMLTSGIIGCGSGSSNSSGKSATTDTVTVTGTAGTITSSATLTVTIP